MIKKIAEDEIPDDAGCFSEYGAVIGDAKEVVIWGNAGVFLVSIDEFEQVEIEGFPCVRPKSSLILAIGGLPETQEQILAHEMNISVECAGDVLYLRTRSRWTQELEAELIELHKEGKPVNICSFGVTPQTQANLYWQASSEARSSSK